MATTHHPTAAGSHCSAPEPRAPGTRRFSINITPAERAGRVILGAAAAIAGIVLLTSAGSAVVLEILLVAAGLDLVVTGALGHCPLYQKLGYTPASLRRPE
ncbi:YgaP family membrane protein [Actinomarinicola tropica]|uniref:DUF2892 domain-containing protein n=1 Tax=Actinomarinicola tropica TaxID=2789776 RepID=A0A5Q2RES6_9ACTN|nr:DUF2892 domain-containing protein [Actinomarinicola tropica]QGG94124.1 DUF2892 domain-containing protein [Actinomarinicola tropica]